MPASGAELALEQAYVDRLYTRLDLLRARTEQALATVRTQDSAETPQALSERDAFDTLHSERLAQLWAVENGLCFGRLDLEDGARRYVGRLGLSDDEYDQLLVDWRAPAAAAFYQATAANPEGVVRRRHITTRDRQVTSLDDEVLDLDALDEADRSTLTGEGALLSAVSAARTGRMRDIVATIQAEQDRVVRADLRGVLVVQGGPGTGKTAVALHRAAYLLYTHRERLRGAGVLVVGPNPTFLRYVEQVLPSLGETDVVLTTVGGLLPGLTATTVDADEVARLKGDLRMAKLVENAVRERQRLPRADVEVLLDKARLVLTRQAADRARSRARRNRRGHNPARATFAKELLTGLAEQYARQLAGSGSRVLDAEDIADLREELREEPAVQSVLDDLWPLLTPQQLLRDLYADPAALSRAGRRLLSDVEQRLLRRVRTPGSPEEWTEGDVPLLDEAAELLGDLPEHDPVAAARARELAEEERYAREALSAMGLGGGMVTAEQLASRYRETGPRLTTAERAATDRTWAFGHVVVDEAQELSPMAWRALVRRCPSRSMTVVGDLAQTGSSAGASSWQDVLAPFAPADRRRVEELTVNYRTPEEVMAVAADVLAAVAPGLAPARSVRAAGVEPRAVRADADLPAAVVDIAREEAAAVGDGRVAVVVPDALLGPVAEAVRAGVDDVALGTAGDALDHRVVVLSVRQTKGLEFDAVVLVEPAEVLAQSPRGGSDLYVALTRATTRLAVVHAGALPEVLRRLAPGSAAA